jgi:lysozyme
MSIFVPDVSFYQGNINFFKMKTAADGVIIRAGQANYADSKFTVNWTGAKAAGIPRGSYWFFDNRFPPLQQAQVWWSLIRSDLGELPHFLDIEGSYAADRAGSARAGEYQIQEGAYGGWRNWRILLDEFKKLSNGKIRIGIYTSYYSFTPLAPTGGAELDYFKQYLLWIANYGVTSPRLPKPWTSWLFWQYGTTPPLPVSSYGVQSSELDSNRFNGTAEQYRKYFNIGGTPPAPEPPPAVASAWRIKTSLNMRSGPGTTFKIIKVLQVADIVEGVFDELTKWIKISAITSNGIKTIPISASYCSGNALYVEPVTPPDQRVTLKIVINDKTDFETEV